MTNRELFLRHLGQTSPSPLNIEIVKARACTIWDVNGKEYIDIIGGISVCNTGHCHPKVIEAIKNQADKYLHLMVYGELVQSPQVEYAAYLTRHLPRSLDSVFFTNSGTEATEGAMKLAKRATGRTQIVAFKDSYHGSTQGALSVMGDEYWRNAFRPLLPGIWHEEYGSNESLQSITEKTAMVIVEAIQAEKGVNLPDKKWLQDLRKVCTENGVLLVLDEIQTGFGRTGKLWAFEQFDIIPDILLLGKALGGGMPLGAFISSRELMQSLTGDPILGHITTFGGHPVSCAAGLASMKVLMEEQLIKDVMKKSALFISLLKHQRILSISCIGLLIGVQFSSFDENKRIIDYCIDNGVFTDWFLFASNSLRIAPPLVISESEIREACKVIIDACDQC